jgi:hypothetical protein
MKFLSAIFTATTAFYLAADYDLASDPVLFTTLFLAGMSALMASALHTVNVIAEQFAHA